VAKHRYNCCSVPTHPVDAADLCQSTHSLARALRWLVTLVEERCPDQLRAGTDSRSAIWLSARASPTLPTLGVARIPPAVR
jgi:hypothetical protein